MSEDKKSFGKLNDKEVFVYTITAKSGAKAEILTYGATLQSVFAPDKNGKLTDVLIGFDDIKGHVERSDYQGQSVGRYANRISGGAFCVDGKRYDITKNEKGVTCLHGGGEFSHAVWDVEDCGENHVSLCYESPENSNGFPGKMNAGVKYTLTDSNELIIEYRAVCTEKTPVNLTNHAYFNLDGGEDVLDTELYINADRFTPTDERSIPTGEMRFVKGTAFDFTAAKKIGRDIKADDEQLVMCRGYDHNFCLNQREPDEAAASAYSEKSGIFMEMRTTLPGVQLYTGNFLSGAPGKGGKPMTQHAGFCLETQFYPDSPNRPEFPDCIYDAGEEYFSRTSFKFSVR